ncbi:uncharacterized protein LOC122067348 [Macadamia integrifolia]|uniref:uncharacterized protein LOC122067348 n=1 Tax=Macadamia integrifolia TaxID=60698 RepID=UPI001C4EDA39|nr:uncharacterized protein LOC122067348 [Macadamia integrifolia]XP_042487109.1 uncharacterized protein LOC122067348 [Macadamia integrifolia]
MPTVWFSLKRSLHCKSEPSDVHDPKTRGHLRTILTKKTARSGCSRSIANLKDVIHGSKRHSEKPPSCSPRSIGSSEFLNPITHEVILSNSRCELKITGFGGLNEGGGGNGGGGGGAGGGSTFVGTLRPGTPGPGGHLNMHHYNPYFTSSATPPRKSPGFLSNREGSAFGVSAFSGGISEGGVFPRASREVDSHGSSTVTCHRCGEQFGKWESLESHHLSKHAVTELVEGDSSRKIVEIICRASLLKSENNCGRIERVLKVHNMQKTLGRFEEYREMVKIKASKLPKKHPRCLADGNELLRFYGTTVACSLGVNGSSNLCVSEKCSVCWIIRHGFSTNKELKGGIGVFTTSTSRRAFECIELYEEHPSSVRKALIVCRVIAGRVHKPLENIQELAGQTGFDSLAGKVGLYSNIEELYLLNPRALLPCFVVICKS